MKTLNLSMLNRALRVAILAIASVTGLTTADAAPEATTTPNPGDFWLTLHDLEPWEWDIDHDQDGFATRTEFHFGTDPLSGNSRFRMWLEGKDGEFRMIWDGIQGANYQIERSPDLKLWDVFPGGPWVGDGRTFEITTLIERSEEYFRVVGLEAADEDGDGLNAVEEGILGTDPALADTDGDGRPDGAEVMFYYTDPLVPNGSGGTIEGRILSDLNGDGDLADGNPLSDSIVYLDLDYNGERSDGEPQRTTVADGSYAFDLLPPGLYHVRQTLPPANTQTVPNPGVSSVLDGVPDEVIEYVHGTGGEFDVPYGQAEGEWKGRQLVIFPAKREAVDVDLVLKPIGVRAEQPPLGTFSTTEFMSLPKEGSITMRFDESIIDGEGADLRIYTLDAGAGEEAEVSIGGTLDTMVSIGSVFENDGSIGIDLGASNVSAPIHYLKIKSLTNGGASPGFDLVGAEAIHFAPLQPDAHAVTIVGDETVSGIEFGRFFKDLPPRVFIGIDGRKGELNRSGETIGIHVSATDDVGIASTILTATGQSVALDADGNSSLVLSQAGAVELIATATDTNGAKTIRSLTLYVADENGALPFDPNEYTPGEDIDPLAPRIVLHSPETGSVLASETPLNMSISSPTGAPTWKIEFAPVAAVDLENLDAQDDDYQLLAEGNAAIDAVDAAMLPVTSLDDGIYFVRATATGNGLTRRFGMVFSKGIAGAALRPRVEITSPTGTTQLSMVQPIVGSIVSERPITEWFAEHAPSASVDIAGIASDTAGWTRFAEGTGIIDNAVIANFDSTLVKNGSYSVRIVARNDLKLGWAEPVLFEVSGETKLGRLHREFVDLSIPLGGFPLEVVRTYDSMEADRSGDFGYGWSLQLRNADIRETVPDTGSGMFGATPFRDGTRVYITTPEGTRAGFTFHLEPAGKSLLGQTFRPIFEADPGVYEKLSVPGDDKGFLAMNDAGEAQVFFTGFAWNPETYILTTVAGQRYTYSEDEGFLEAEDLNGNTLTVVEDGIVHSAGLKLVFKRDAKGRIDTIIDPDGGIWSYEYNELGELENVIDPDGVTRTYSYHEAPAHFLKDVMHPEGCCGGSGVTYEYDESGRLAAIVDPDGNRKVQTFDPGSFEGSTTDRLGNTTKIVYNERGNIVQTTDPLGHVTKMAYTDAANPDKVTMETDPLGHVTEREYDPRGNLVLETLAGGAKVRAEYDGHGRLLSSSTPDGNRATFAYDHNGNLTSRDLPNASPETLHYTDDGQLEQIVDDEGFARSFGYNNQGALERVSDQSGLTYGVGSDRRGRVTSIQLADEKEWAFELDANGNPVHQTDPTGNTKSVSKESDGRRSVTDRLGNKTTYRLGQDSFPENVVLPTGAELNYEYDDERNLEAIVDASGNRTEFGYDDALRYDTRRDFAGNVRKLGYDAVGNVTSVIDRNGRKRTFEFDDNNNLTHEFWHESKTDEVIHEIVFEYRGTRLHSVTEGDATWVYGVNYERPHSVKVTYAGRKAVTIAYDWKQRDIPQAVRIVSHDNVRQGSIATEFDGWRPTAFRWTHPGGEGGHVRMLRGGNGHIERIERYAASFPRSEQTPFSVTRKTFSHTNYLMSYAHENGSGELVSPDASALFERDAEGRIELATEASNVADYSYNSLGELETVTHTSRDDESYTYDTSGNRKSSHLLGASMIVAGNRIESMGHLSYGYDAEGNLTRRTNSTNGEIATFDYDHRNRMILASVRASEAAPVTTTVQFAYDYRDRLTRRTINGTSTWIYYDREMPLAEYTAASDTTPSRMYFYALDAMDDFYGTWDETGGEKWFLHDNIGSVRGILDDKGTLHGWVSYDAFGNIVGGNTPSKLNEIRFAGRHWIAELGLYDNRARLYDPTLGRFTQEDPLGYRGRDYNLYRYACNNPLVFTDPLGTQTAVEYATMAAVLARPGTFCKFAKCVGDLYSGIAKAVIEHDPGAPPNNLCPLELLPLPPDPRTKKGATKIINALGPRLPLPPAEQALGVVNCVMD